MRSDGRHLGPGFLGEDGGHDVTAERRARLEEVPAWVDCQARAISGEPRLEPGGDGSGEVPPSPVAPKSTISGLCFSTR